MITRWVKRFFVALALLPIVAIAAETAAGFALGYPPALTYLLHEAPFRGEAFDRKKWLKAGLCANAPDWHCPDTGRLMPAAGRWCTICCRTICW